MVVAKSDDASSTSVEHHDSGSAVSIYTVDSNQFEYYTTHPVSNPNMSYLWSNVHYYRRAEFAKWPRYRVHRYSKQSSNNQRNS